MIKWNKELRDILIDAYLDYRNDYLTIDNALSLRITV